MKKSEYNFMMIHTYATIAIVTLTGAIGGWWCAFAGAAAGLTVQVILAIGIHLGKASK